MAHYHPISYETEGRIRQGEKLEQARAVRARPHPSVSLFEGIQNMKRQNLLQNPLWIIVAMLIVLVVFAFGFLAAEDVAAKNPPPVYSLSAGAVGMIAGPGYVSDGANFQMPEELVTDAVQRYLERQGDPDLAVTRRLEFYSAYQLDVIEQSSGRYAFGLMVGKDSGQVSPKAGPNIFWNIKYGAQLGEIGGGYGMVGHLTSSTVPDEMPLAESEARSLAASSILQMGDGSKLDGEARSYYGFYQFDVNKGGELVGELAVNGHNGQIWYEQWGEPLMAVQNVDGDR